MKRNAFTLIELLVTVTIIVVLASMVYGALQMSRESGRDAATKATIAKLNDIIMERWESYATRRVPISIPESLGLTLPQKAQVRLAALRDLMRMEMPERWDDVSDGAGALPFLTPTAAPNNVVPEPALHSLYRSRYAAKSPNANYSHAKCLYMVVSMGSPEAMEQFRQDEIASDTDGWQYFVDGWGKPIYWLRWAPGCVSVIQQPFLPTDTTQQKIDKHDPFDSRMTDAAGFRLIPLIYSFGRDTAAAAALGTNTGNVETGTSVHFQDPSSTPANCVPTTICGMAAYQGNGAPKAGTTGALGNVTNHAMEQR